MKTVPDMLAYSLSAVVVITAVFNVLLWLLSMVVSIAAAELLANAIIIIAGFFFGLRYYRVTKPGVTTTVVVVKPLRIGTRA